MSREQYERECKRIRDHRRDMERLEQERMRRTLFPENDDHALRLARQIGRERDGMNRRANGIENYFVK